MNPEAETEYREFVAARLDQLGRFAFLLCRDWHRAEDAVQKALVKLYLHWDRTTIKSPDAYVRRIIVNVVREEARRHWFQRERSSRRLPERELPDHGDSGVERVTMLDALSRLPKRQRIAVVLRHWEDLSVEQTADIMDCSTGTVKSQTARGLQTLRGLLNESIPQGAVQ
ncbi:MAG: SigE family RNA polymerase sigma factor [Stackebrandtia sp.]